MPDSEHLKEVRPLFGRFLMTWPAWTKALLALGLTLATLLGRLSFGHAPGDPPSLILFVIPIIISAYVGGFWTGLLSTLTAFLTSAYYLLFPLDSFVISDIRNQISWFGLLLAGILISALIEALHRDRKMLLSTIAELKRAERFRLDVERIIRHDVKSPLMGLHTMAQFMLDDGMNDVVREALPELVHSVRNVCNLLDSSEKIHQMEQAKYTPKAAWFDLGQTMGCVERSLAPLSKAIKVRLTKAGPFERLLVFGEEILIESMLTNLVRNAIEAAPKASAVTVSCDVEQDELRIAIHNLGAVPESIRNRFFEKYSTSGKPFGTGLGTYSANLIAKAHGGRIEFRTAETEGTTVTVILPHPGGAHQQQPD
ncbi:MAG: HAMP domain-containing sensor histidine kinase [Thermodesulfobacteriota bacterium]